MTHTLTELDEHGWTPDSWSPVSGWWAPRPTYVWYVEVTAYPPGSQEPGWSPPGWAQYMRKQKLRRPWAKISAFRWPRRHSFLSASGAYGQAGYLTQCGAAVQVHRSMAVLWPVLPDDEAEFDASGIPLEKGRPS